jgi:hypothetical protein
VSDSLYAQYFFELRSLLEVHTLVKDKLPIYGDNRNEQRLDANNKYFDAIRSEQLEFGRSTTTDDLTPSFTYRFNPVPY